MIAAVTGGAGFAGTHLVRRLLDLPRVTVRSFDNLSRGHFPGQIHPRLDCIPGDVRDISAVREVVRSCDVVFHMAAQATVMGCEQWPEEAHETNVTGTWNVLRVAAEAGVRRIVVASSREVYGDGAVLPLGEDAPLRPKNVYGANKAAAEMYCNWAASFLEVAVLRLSNVFGPGDRDRVIPRFLHAARNNLPLTIHGGNQVVDFVWVGHVVEAFIRAGLQLHVKGPVNVASGEGTTIREVARRIMQLTSSESALQVLQPRDTEVSAFIADTTRLRAELGIAIPSDSLSNLSLMCESSRGLTGQSSVSYVQSRS